jgi:hypothetical protein
LSWANASSRSRSSHQAAALSRFAPMTNFSIPSSTPVTGRISTKSSARSRSSNNLQSFCRESCQLPLQPRHYSKTIRRVKGAWWPSRSSKPLSIPHMQGRDRFDSYPLRQMEFDVRFLMFDLRSARQFPSNFKHQTSSKGVILDVA